MIFLTHLFDSSSIMHKNRNHTFLSGNTSYMFGGFKLKNKNKRSKDIFPMLSSMQCNMCYKNKQFASTF